MVSMAIPPKNDSGCSCVSGAFSHQLQGLESWNSLPNTKERTPNPDFWRLKSAAFMVTLLAAAMLLATMLVAHPAASLGPGRTLQEKSYSRRAGPVRASRRSTNGMSRNHGVSVEGGMLNSSTAMFAMIARDNAKFLPYTLNNVKRLALKFRKSYVLLIENDSSDTTVALFREWLQQLSNTTILGEARPHLWGLPRRRNLTVYAKARNEYLKALAEPQYADVDLLVAVDTDMCAPWDINSIERVLNDVMFPLAQPSSKLDAVYAYGACGWYSSPVVGSSVVSPYSPGAYARFCDVFALQDLSGKRYKIKEGPKFHHLKGKWRLPVMPLQNASDNALCDFAEMQAVGCNVFKGHPVVPVRSAFGGLGILRASMLRPDPSDGMFTYAAPNQTSTGSHSIDSRNPCAYASDGDECEHVPLGNCLFERGYKQAIALDLIVTWEKEACRGAVTDQLHHSNITQHWKSFTEVRKVIGGKG